MKCPHCGIHFDDEERVCPFCGCRVTGRAAGKRKDCKLNTDTGFFSDKKLKKQTFTHDQTFMKKRAAPRPKKARKKKKPAIVVLLVVFFFLIMPAIVSIINFVNSDSLSELTDPDTLEEEVEYSSDFIGSYTNAAGAVLELSDYNSFVLTENGFSYTGYYDIVGLSESYQDSRYPASSYTGYELYFSFDDDATPMPDGDDYAFYEMYVPIGEGSDTMFLVDYEDSGTDSLFTLS